MIACARRAFPGMVMSLALSASLLSAHAMAATPRTEKTATTAHHAPGASHPALGSRPAMRPSLARTNGLPSAEHRLVVPRSHSTGVGHGPTIRLISTRSSARSTSVHKATSTDQVVHRPVGNAPALIDDGTLWREQGGLATWQQTGVASWYGGSRWHGRQTTSGSRYDQNELTAAHATLPIGTRVRVTLHDNAARFVIVTINDRPGTRSRIIDLSREAAAALGILSRGVAMVTLTPL